MRKDVHPDDVGERLLRRATAPDYMGRSLTLTMRSGLLRPADRVLLVDDWMETGGQAIAAMDLVHMPRRPGLERPWLSTRCPPGRGES
jgi:adenine phosphoribosyltransferase